jgi:hypothetical protein
MQSCHKKKHCAKKIKKQNLRKRTKSNHKRMYKETIDNFIKKSDWKTKYKLDSI